MSGSVTVRLADVEDLEAIVGIERATVEAPHWGVEVYRAALVGAAGTGAGVERRVLVAEIGEADGGFVEGGRSQRSGEVVGFVVGRVVRGEVGAAEGEMESVAVAERWRRQGIAGAMCAELLRWFRGQDVAWVELEVRAGSGAARSLYARLGFLEQGVRRGYYAEPTEDAVLMHLWLDSPGAGRG